MRIDAHHHLWDLNAVSYPWLMERGAVRFFGDPTPIQRDYLIDEFRADADWFDGSVHIQVGAADPCDEAAWVQKVADANADWPMTQVVFCDVTADDLDGQLDRFQTLSTVRGVRQIVGRAPGEDAKTGTNGLLADPRFAEGLRRAGARGLSFDLQLIPDLYSDMARVLDHAPETAIALCHCGSPTDRSAAGHAAWAEALRLLSERPQVTCKLSGLGMFDHDWTVETIRPFVETCLDQFGPTRCMFGSNFPVDSLYSDYAILLSAMRQIVPADMHEAVFGATAAAFYRMGV
ncbi:amidohydrolase family protein [Yoonia litorea]|uniref:Predicted metal-dependent hydrolase, TIM-barrel fold n=1 Tax=Yoonia litorea TaxID=1123755 RepID=A0A1I6N1Q4_9RHOB|nr:amidohydrolase family protein [Yoonia litorea]SFS21883.1 Predicted metal-dependent hydrolase, TIM-barrel fold [Yoonia litorea]